MQRLLDFLYQRRVILIFIGLEVLCAWLIVSYNAQYNANFFNSNNLLAARISSMSQGISDYFTLKEINVQLRNENQQLEQELLRLKAERDVYRDTLGQFSVIEARVINNTFRRSTNYLTVSGGEKDGLQPGLGVITPSGVVGQVKSVSRNYATIYSLLHPNVLVSSKVKRTETKCTVQWDQADHTRASVKYIPRHIDLKEGDTVVTSGFNSVFPPNVSVGIIDELNLEEHMTFYEAKLRLATDFSSIPYVFVIVDEMKNEKDSLEQL